MENRLIDNADNPRLNHWHIRLIKQSEKLMLFRQRFWGRVTRKQQLTAGDRNARFFHQTATARKRRTYISRIKNEIDGWIEEIHLIKAKFCHDFAQRFTSSHSTRTTLTLITAMRKVTATENLSLIQPVQRKRFNKPSFR